MSPLMESSYWSLPQCWVLWLAAIHDHWLSSQVASLASLHLFEVVHNSILRETPSQGIEAPRGGGRHPRPGPIWGDFKLSEYLPSPGLSLVKTTFYVIWLAKAVKTDSPGQLSVLAPAVNTWALLNKFHSCYIRISQIFIIILVESIK